jgi:hypothetical protein
MAVGSVLPISHQAIPTSHAAKVEEQKGEDLAAVFNEGIRYRAQEGGAFITRDPSY